VLLFVVMIIIFVFAHPVIRKKAYKFFWSTHSLYVVLYILCLVHGLARLTGAPRFWLFFIGPGIIYTLDKVSQNFIGGGIICTLDKVSLSEFYN
jgi:dual oxidase